MEDVEVLECFSIGDVNVSLGDGAGFSLTCELFLKGKGLTVASF